MSFCTYSGEFTANMYTSVENRFITRFLPQADGDAVRVYLYGLYLCQCSQPLDAESAAKLLHIDPQKLVELFCFWEECDLVHVLSKDPLFVEYLPVNAAVGKPKPVRPEKYADFNRALYKILQRAGRDFKPYEIQHILEFLEKEPMEQQAFLLVAEYCASKKGSGLSANYILNKAEKLCADRRYTYEQVEAYFSDFNVHERDVERIFALLGSFKKPQEADYEYLEKWLARGASVKTVCAAAEYLKKGTMKSLDILMEELFGREIFTEEAARDYLARRAETTDVVYKIARKLGVKVENPRPYAEAYCEKWLERGYDADSLALLAGICMRMGGGFEELDGTVGQLYRDGIVDAEGVKDYVSAREKELKLLQRIGELCGSVKKSQSALDMIGVWRSWNFSDEMILEAAKRSAGAGSPLPYMNKLLSEWKRAGAFSPKDVPEKNASSYVSPYQKEAAVAADIRAERERYYAALHSKAIRSAEAAKKRAEQDEDYRIANAAIRNGEIELARAEVYAKEDAPVWRGKLDRAREDKKNALLRLGLTEEDLLPVYSCKKCSDTGFLPDGKMCDCYPKDK